MSCTDLGAVCGDQSDGCGGTLPCGICDASATCVMGQCACADDGGEPNDALEEAHRLPDFTDSPDTSMTFDAFATSDAMDDDWFRVAVTDALDGGNPAIRITLDNIPPGSDLDLAAWYVCNDGTASHTCTAGIPDSTVGQGCSASASGVTSELVGIDTECNSTTDESGTLYVRVQVHDWGGTCGPYRLRIDVT